MTQCGHAANCLIVFSQTIGVGCATCENLEYSSIYGGQLEVQLPLELH